MIVKHLLAGYGLYLTTPITLTRRLRVMPVGQLADFDLAIFDEIDTYLTVDDLEERQDTWPALKIVLDAGIPVLGFTGTHLSKTQKGAWIKRGFDETATAVPDDWMPKTRVAFIGVHDPGVIALDASIRDELGKAFALLGGPLTSWSEVKRRAEAGDGDALAVLRLCGERLRLFESAGSAGSKYATLAAAARADTPTLVMSRYVDVAQELTHVLRIAGLAAEETDGSHRREDIKRRMAWFRSEPPGSTSALVMTRDLGGRGLDFPNAGSAVFVSPRSNYQTVAQEVARIRSRGSNVKSATFFYYSDTEEQAKARRLAQHLSADRFGDARLFEIDTIPGEFALEPFESITMRNEEALTGGRLERRLPSRSSPSLDSNRAGGRRSGPARL